MAGRRPSFQFMCTWIQYWYCKQYSLGQFVPASLLHPQPQRHSAALLPGALLSPLAVLKRLLPLPLGVAVSKASVENWLDGLGYGGPAGFSAPGVTTWCLPRTLTRWKIHALLQGDGSVRARAVFDVEGVPTIVFLDDAPVGGLCRRRSWTRCASASGTRTWPPLWFIVRGDRAIAYPARKLESAQQTLGLEEIRRDGPFFCI